MYINIHPIHTQFVPDLLLVLPFSFICMILCRRKFTLIGHRAEISNAQFNYDSSLIATASMDQTAKLWDSRTGQIIATLRAHEDEVLDVTFDYTGMKLATASADGTLCHGIMGNF